MEEEQREKLIEKIGIEATDYIVSLEKDIEALHDYLKVVRQYGTKGFTLVENVALSAKSDTTESRSDID